MKKKILLILLFIPFMTLILSCSRSPIEKALKGKLKSMDENVAVSNHCQSCHLHSDFVPELHIVKMNKKYQDFSLLRKSSRCLQCHDLELENIFSREKRFTNIPHGKIFSKIPSEKEFKEKTKLPKEKKINKKHKQKNKDRSWYFFYLY
ncbi:MAG: hypothetical protein VX794_09950 [Nitrospinota bacterium]|nr:hypothetical protein [Nitrospinota bacterium]